MEKDKGKENLKNQPDKKMSTRAKYLLVEKMNKLQNQQIIKK